jgi:hypothetical protein
MSISINADNVVQVACKQTGCRCVPISSKGLPVSIKLAIDNTMEDGHSRVVLPVYEIDGLKVRCDFIVNENGMSLWIITSKMLMYDTTPEDRAFIVHQMLFRKTYIKKLTKYTLKDYESVIRHMNNDINNMKFDKLNGVFVTPQIEHPMNVPHVCSNEENINRVPCNDKHPEECSVCLDTTKTTTPCGHKLCVSCWCQIKPKGRELPCPICRADLFQAKKIRIIDSKVDEDVADNENVDNDWYDAEEDDDHDDDDLDNSFINERGPLSVRGNSIMEMR